MNDPLLDSWLSELTENVTYRDLLILVSKVRARDNAAAHDAVSLMPIHSFPDGGMQAAIVFRDGWATGYQAGYEARTAEILDLMSMTLQ